MRENILIGCPLTMGTIFFVDHQNTGKYLTKRKAEDTGVEPVPKAPKKLLLNGFQPLFRDNDRLKGLAQINTHPNNQVSDLCPGHTLCDR